ncbi:hypothetical protein FF1_034906 [Malus domestica]
MMGEVEEEEEEEEDAQNSPRWELKLGIHGGHKSLASMMITEALGIHDITEALGIEDCKNESPKLAEAQGGEVRRAEMV